MSFLLGKERECICSRVAHYYAADLFVPILDRGRNAKEREIGFLPCTVYMCKPYYHYLFFKVIRIAAEILLNSNNIICNLLLIA